jgi:hypothetical protein
MDENNEHPENEDDGPSKPMESSTSADQIQQQSAFEPKTRSSLSQRGVFIIRKSGMPFEEFKKVCIQRFKAAGLITEKGNEEEKS